MFYPVAISILCVLGWLVWKTLQIGKRDPRLPLRPPTIPLLGNAHLIPTTGLANK
jgi:hypothetical protein